MPQIPRNLRLDFEERVHKDNAQFGIRSIYLPNPVLSDSPRICVIALEPAVRPSALARLHQDINEGYLNFLGSPQDFILHFCLYNACGMTFDYHISDLSKGAMIADDAQKNRDKRYLLWLPLLKKELAHFGNPKLVALGRVPERFLRRHEIQVAEYLMHHSLRNRQKFTRIYKERGSKRLPQNLHTAITTFSEHLLNLVSSFPPVRHRIIEHFKEELPDWQKGIYLSYMEKLRLLNR